MTSTATHTDGSTAAVLDGLRAKSAEIARAEVEKAELTIEWAVLNEADPAECVGLFADKALPVAGAGAPLVSEFALMEYAAALGVTTESGFAQVGGILELRYRLPKLWDRVLAGELPLWRARRIAAHTISLPIAGAAHVDRHLAPVAHSCSWAQLDRTVEEAMVRFDPAAAEAKRREAAERQHVDVQVDQVSYDGTVHIDAEVDLADALDFEDVIRAGANEQARPGLDRFVERPPRQSPRRPRPPPARLRVRQHRARPRRRPRRPPLRGRPDRHRDRRPVRQHQIPDQRGPDQGVVQTPRTSP